MLTNAESNGMEYRPFTGRGHDDFVNNYRFGSYIDQLPLSQILLENEQFIVLWINKSQLLSGVMVGHPTIRFAHKTLKNPFVNGQNSDYGYNENRYLLLFNKKSEKIVAFNELGYVDNESNHQEGKKLISKKLFSIDNALWNTNAPILILGNLSVNDEYRQNEKALKLWWKGLGKYITLHPSCKFLMSLVTLGPQYEAISRQLAVTFFSQAPYLNECGKFVNSVNPGQSTPVKSWNNNAFTEIFQEVEELNALIKEIESDKRRLPITFLYFLELGAEFLGFSSTPDSENCITGLIWIDLTNTDLPPLEQFMGRDDAEFYLKQHALGQ